MWILKEKKSVLHLNSLEAKLQFPTSNLSAAGLTAPEHKGWNFLSRPVVYHWGLIEAHLDQINEAKGFPKKL